MGEPQLGRRGLYEKMGGQQDIEEHQLALLWVLNLSDGTHSLLDIAERSGLSFKRLCRAAEDLTPVPIADTGVLTVVGSTGYFPCGDRRH